MPARYPHQRTVPAPRPHEVTLDANHLGEAEGAGCGRHTPLLGLGGNRWGVLVAHPLNEHGANLAWGEQLHHVAALV